MTHTAGIVNVLAGVQEGLRIASDPSVHKERTPGFVHPTQDGVSLGHFLVIGEADSRPSVRVTGCYRETVKVLVE